MIAGEPFLRKRFPRTPSQKLFDKRVIEKILKIRIDVRRERTARFGCREKSGATETLLSQKVEWKQQRDS